MKYNKEQTIFLVILVLAIFLVGFVVFTNFFDKNLQSNKSVDDETEHKHLLTEWDEVKASEFKNLGEIGSQHLHADLKVYLNGKQVDLSFAEYGARRAQNKNVSNFMHTELGTPPEKVGDVIHMHATNVPLKLFFESIDLPVDKDCITVSGKKYCKIKMYVNGKPAGNFSTHVFRNLDKILLTDGIGNVKQQLLSVTDYAK